MLVKKGSIFSIYFMLALFHSIYSKSKLPINPLGLVTVDGPKLDNRYASHRWTFHALQLLNTNTSTAKCIMFKVVKQNLKLTLLFACVLWCKTSHVIKIFAGTGII